MNIEQIDPGAAALLWVQTYVLAHTGQTPELREACLMASKRYAEYAPKGALYDAAHKRGHIKMAAIIKTRRRS
jgi:hypothetical protein